MNQIAKSFNVWWCILGNSELQHSSDKTSFIFIDQKIYSVNDKIQSPTPMLNWIRIPSDKVKTFYSESTKSSLRAIVGNFESEGKYLITKSDTGVIQTIKNKMIEF